MLAASPEPLKQTADRDRGFATAVFDGVRMVLLQTAAFKKRSSWRRVLSWFDFEWRILAADLSALPKPDVIIVSSLSLFSVLNGIRLARRHHCPWVFEVRDIWPLTLTEYGGASRYHPLTLLMGWIERLGYREADAVVGTMPNLSPHASRIAGREISCTCIPFGFDPATAVRPDVPAAPAAIRFPRQNDQLVVGYAGKMGISNALETFITACQQLSDDSRFQFVFLGDGDLREHFMQRTSQCRNVHWLGKVKREEVHSILRQCDLLYFGTHPSKVWEYGMSLNKLTDYLLAQKPVLASYSGYPSIINEAGCGEFVPAGDTPALIDALGRFAAMPRSDLETMGQAGFQWLMHNRPWGTIAQQYLALLDGLSGGTQR